MNTPQPERTGKFNRRKEKRFKTSADQRLRCRTSIDEPGRDQIWEGTAVDISPSGMRLLCKGDFRVGQPIWTELTTTRSHGIYRGNVRRIEPWVGGDMILGCSLRDTIPGEVLQELARDGIINRRADGRFSISHRACISWPLSADEIDVDIQDYSSGGMKLHSTEPVPEGVRLRVRFESEEQEIFVEARSIWSRQVEEGWITGVAFADRDTPTVVTETLGRESQAKKDASEEEGPGKARQALTMAAFLTLFIYVVFAVL